MARPRNPQPLRHQPTATPRAATAPTEDHNVQNIPTGKRSQHREGPQHSRQVQPQSVKPHNMPTHTNITMPNSESVVGVVGVILGYVFCNISDCCGASGVLGVNLPRYYLEDKDN